MLAVLALFFLLFTAGAFVPFTASVFAYARVEKRHRSAWAGLAQHTVHVDAGPYRGSVIVPARLDRAPALVRAAALGCFYWSWFCALTWVGVGVVGRELPVLAPVVVAGVAVALSLAWTGKRLLRRDTRVVSSGRRVAIGAGVHAACVVMLAVGLGGVDWGGPALVFAGVTVAVAALLVLAVRRNAWLFVHPRRDGAASPSLPVWLARMLARRAPSPCR